MKHPKQLLAVLLMAAACTMQAQRNEALLEKNWKSVKEILKRPVSRSSMTLNGNRLLFHTTGRFWSIRHEQ